MAVRDALEEIASPLDTYGWSSSGIYCFWNPDTRDVLYIGLAIDLPNRFAQHTGLSSCPLSGCKRVQIDAWFSDHPDIGYSVLLQTPNVQVMGHRAAKEFGLDLKEAKSDPTVDVDPLPGELQEFEGRLIEAHRLAFGARPPWNQMGGSLVGAQQVAGLPPDDLFAVVSGRKDNPIVARRSIRDLANDATAVTFEDYIHTARITATMYGSLSSDERFLDVMKYLDRLDDPFEMRARIVRSGYLEISAPFNLQ